MNFVQDVFFGVGYSAGEMMDTTPGHLSGHRNHGRLLIASMVVFACPLVGLWGAFVLVPELITLTLSIGVVYVDAGRKWPLVMGIAGILFSLAAVAFAILWLYLLVQAGHC